MNHDANFIVQLVVAVILALVSLLPLFIVLTVGVHFMIDWFKGHTKPKHLYRVKLKVLDGGKKETRS